MTVYASLDRLSTYIFSIKWAARSDSELNLIPRSFSTHSRIRCDTESLSSSSKSLFICEKIIRITFFFFREKLRCKSSIKLFNDIPTNTEGSIPKETILSKIKSKLLGFQSSNRLGQENIFHQVLGVFYLWISNFWQNFVKFSSYYRLKVLAISCLGKFCWAKEIFFSALGPLILIHLQGFVQFSHNTLIKMKIAQNQSKINCPFIEKITFQQNFTMFLTFALRNFYHNFAQIETKNDYYKNCAKCIPVKYKFCWLISNFWREIISSWEFAPKCFRFRNFAEKQIFAPFLFNRATLYSKTDHLFCEWIDWLPLWLTFLCKTLVSTDPPTWASSWGQRSNTASCLWCPDALAWLAGKPASWLCRNPPLKVASTRSDYSIPLREKAVWKSRFFIVFFSAQNLQVIVVNLVFWQRNLWIFLQMSLDPSYSELYLVPAAQRVQRSVKGRILTPNMTIFSRNYSLS